MMEHASAAHFTHPADGPDAWVQYFGLRYNPFYNPFAVTDDGSELVEDTFYPGARRAELLDQADHACHASSGVTVIAGAEGSGRSLMCRQLHLILQRDARVAFLQAQLLSSAEQVLQAIAADLQCQLPVDASAGEIMATLRHELQVPGKPLVILIDDAHLLDDGLLGGLMSLLVDASESERILHVLMFGDDALTARLDSYAPVEILLQDLVLTSLSIKETSEYLQHKWSQAGASQPLPLSPLQLQRLWQRSGGVPGSLDHLAEAALVQLASEADIRSGIPIAHLFALIALVSILLVAFLYWDKWFEVEVEIPVEPATQDVQAQVREEAVRRLTAPLSVPVPAASTGSGAPPRASAPASRGEIVNAPPQGAAERFEAVVPDSGSSAVVAREQPAAEPATNMTPIATVPAATAPEAREPVPVADSLTGAERQLLGMPAAHLLLQVMAAGAREPLLEFVRAQPNRADLLLYETARNGKPWFVVVIGSFADRAAVTRHLASLPEVQRNAGPWIRSVADVQADIRQYRGR